MQIYIACLAAYNNGQLHGRWIDAQSDVDAMQEEVDAILASSPQPDAEEWAVHDYDDFPNLGEYPGLEQIAEYAALIEDHTEIERGDLLAILNDFSSLDEASDALNDSFCGIFDTFRDYADDMADDSLRCHGIRDDSPLARYFDYEAFARELAMDMHTIDCPSGVAVFYA